VALYFRRAEIHRSKREQGQSMLDNETGSLVTIELARLGNQFDSVSSVPECDELMLSTGISIAGFV
jgi:hypothetical protein